MRKRPTGRDVAERAGVSLTTVSFVLNGKKHTAIAEETRERVLQAARDLGYRPNGLVRGLVRGKTQTIGLVVPRLDSSFHAAIVQGIQQVCGERGYRILLADSAHRFDQEQREVDLLLQHRVDGLISVALPDDVPTRLLDLWLAGLVREGVAIVVVDDHQEEQRVDCVTSDDEHGARLAVEHLLACGHRRIAHLSAGQVMSSSRGRRAGYESALRAAGVPVDPELIAGTSYFMPSDEMRAAVAFLLDRPDKPTAVFAANDDMAAECIAAARALGFHVPDSLAVVGYGNTDAGRYLSITTIHQDPISMGRRSAERIFARMEHPDLAPEHTMLPVSLIVRDSSAATCRPGSPAAGSAAANVPAARPARAQRGHTQRGDT